MPFFFPHYALKAPARHPEGWRFRSLSEKESRAQREKINAHTKTQGDALGC
jgi:hypothetical protein